MNIARFTFNSLGENTYVVWDESCEAVIVDAGNYNQIEDEKLFAFIEAKGLTVKYLLNTHGHFDHTPGIEVLRGRYGAPFCMNSADEPLLRQAVTQGRLFGFRAATEPLTIDKELADGDKVTFGNTTLEVLHTPGHCPGHLCYFNREDGVLFTGDTLFRESIGRTDLLGGDYDQIMESIVKKIIPLGDEVRIYPGHGGDSSVGHEAMYNPFVAEVLQGGFNQPYEE